MSTSILIARYIGPVMLVAALAGLLNPKQIMAIFEDFSISNGSWRKDPFGAYDGVLIDRSTVASTYHADNNPWGSSNGHGFGSQMIDELFEFSFGLWVSLYTAENGFNLL